MRRIVCGISLFLFLAALPVLSWADDLSECLTLLQQTTDELESTTDLLENSKSLMTDLENMNSELMIKLKDRDRRLTKIETSLSESLQRVEQLEKQRLWIGVASFIGGAVLGLTISLR